MKQRQFRIVKMTTSHTKETSYKVEELKKFLWFKPKWRVCKYPFTCFCGTTYNTRFDSKKDAQDFINRRLDVIKEKVVK